MLPYWVAGSPPQRPPVAVVRFTAASTVYFGDPNDEAFSGHPLFDAGLNYYTFAAGSMDAMAPIVESLAGR